MTIDVPIFIHPKRNGVAIVVRWNNKILACQRIGCRDANGTWQLPGGAIDENESAESAASRELLEEANIFVNRHGFDRLHTGIGAMPDGAVHVTTFFKFDFEDDPKPDNMEPDKHGDWEWLTKEELLSRPIIELIRPVLESI